MTYYKIYCNILHRFSFLIYFSILNFKTLILEQEVGMRFKTLHSESHIQCCEKTCMNQGSNETQTQNPSTSREDFAVLVIQTCVATALKFQSNYQGLNMS